MRLMSESQIQHYNANYKKLELNATKMQEKCLIEFLNNFMQSFASDLEANSLQCEYQVSPDFSRDIMTKFKLDWNIYKSILFHLISNAIKHSKKHSKIVFKFFQYE